MIALIWLEAVWILAAWGVVILVLLVHAVCCPQGYEDEDGFHLGVPPADEGKVPATTETGQELAEPHGPDWSEKGRE